MPKLLLEHPGGELMEIEELFRETTRKYSDLVEKIPAGF